MKDNQKLENLIFQKGSELLTKSQSHNSAFLKKNWWYKKMLSWAMRDKKLKTQLLRFIDVLPSLSGNQQFLSHFKEYFKDQEIGFISSGLGRLAPSLMVKNIKKQIRQVAKMFIIGSNIEEALKIISKNWEQDLAFSIDILGEVALSEEEAEGYLQQYLQLMDSLISAQKNWPKRDLLQKDSQGPIPSINISVKASSLFSQIKTEAWEYSKERIKSRLRPLFQKAVKNFVFIYMDMEQYHYKDLFLEIFKELTMEEDLKHYPHFGIVIQAYLKESFEDLQKLSRFAESRNTPLTVRLVKGAYWDTEVLLARQKNWPIPVYLKKEETEANFEKCLQWLFENPSKIKLAIGSHNIRSVACALAWHKLCPEMPLEFQTLYGMGEGLAQSLRDEGQRVRLYCGMGELIPGMSYLVRRLLENSNSQSFVLNFFVHNKSAKELLSPPQAQEDKRDHLKTDSFKNVKFKNHPLLDFSQKENISRFKKALEGWKRKFPIEVPSIIEGEQLSSSQVFNRENPSHPQQIISRSFLVSTEQAEKAVQIASSFFSEWRLSPAQKRVSCLRRLAQLLQEKEFELAGLQVFEVGKTWGEAQADVAEAIDFCNYYAFRYEQMMNSKKTAEVSGEDSWSRFEPIGPTVVIAPWNFPLAILTGMTVAPLLCGNTVLIKPAEQSALTAFELSQLLIKSGFPKQSFAFLPGRGEEVGQYLAQHSKVPIVSFTGSFEVGAQIIKAGGHIRDEQIEFKKCIVEMGGKNAIVIDSSADLDSAISGVLISAFGFQGQKCSACSRLIVLESIYESFMKRFVPAVKSLEVGPPEDPRFSLGPLIDKESFEKIQNFKQREKSQKLVEGFSKNGPWFCPPTVYLSNTKGSSALMQKELFAPVLALSTAKDWNSAIRQANESCFGLTMALYSRHPGHIEEFKLLSEAGNVYINRSCTGAVVERHPFGGRKRSGLGSKAGGPDYLQQFLHKKIVTENSMRKGFAPEIFLEE